MTQFYEIYWVKVKLGKSNKIRPCVILDQIDSSAEIKIAFVSSALDLYMNRHLHFKLEASHPDFPATHLRRTSFIICDFINNSNIDQVVHRWINNNTWASISRFAKL